MNTIYICASAAISLAMIACSGPGMNYYYPSSELVNMESVQVSASSWEQKTNGGWADFPPELTIDGDLTGKSSWRVEVHDKTQGQWVQYDLGQMKIFDAIDIQFLSGGSRKYTFDISLSDDGQKWQYVFEGESAGTAPGFEKYTLSGKTARYIRLTGYGNTSEKFPNWFNIVDVKIYAR